MDDEHVFLNDVRQRQQVEQLATRVDCALIESVAPDRAKALNDAHTHTPHRTASHRTASHHTKQTHTTRALTQLVCRASALHDAARDLQAKTTKKIVLRLECVKCGGRHQQVISRCKSFELGGDKKQKGR